MSAPAPNLVNLERVSKAYGIRPLLAEVSLGVGAEQRIGVVGRNGDGKTTLLHVLAGIEEPDAGRVSHARALRLGLGQDVRRVAAVVLVDDGVVDLPGPVAHRVEEPAVVSHHHERRGSRDQVPCEPVDRFDVEMVGRLVEDQQVVVAEQ